MPKKGSGKDREDKIRAVCNGVLSSHEIAAIVGDNAKYVQRVMLKYDLPRLKQSPPNGSRNPSFVSGRRIDRDGYAIVTAPLDHPYARSRNKRNYGIIYEHRLVMEDKLSRYLLPTEIVDHIDGLRLHNDPSNLRLFSSNAHHLKETLSGHVPQWSSKGIEKLLSRKVSGLQPVHTYVQMKKSGDARLREILLTAIALGEDSPYLLGTTHHLKKAGIFDLSRSNLILELERLSQRYA